MDSDNLIHVGNSLLEKVAIYIETIKDAELTNSQFFINFLDSLNELSVKY